MRVITGNAAALRASLMDDVGRYRHKVFVERLGWPLRCADGLEFDEFDRDDTVHVVALDDARIVGIARLLPTDRPYLLGSVFRKLLGGAPAPGSAEVWELSRFAAIDLDAPVTGRQVHISSPAALALLRASMDCARLRGARSLVSVSPAGAERLLRNAGIPARRLGPILDFDGQALFACSIDLHRQPLSMNRGTRLVPGRLAVPTLAPDGAVALQESQT